MKFTKYPLTKIFSISLWMIYTRVFREYWRCMTILCAFKNYWGQRKEKSIYSGFYVIESSIFFKGRQQWFSSLCEEIDIQSLLVTFKRTHLLLGQNRLWTFTVFIKVQHVSLLRCYNLPRDAEKIKIKRGNNITSARKSRFDCVTV